MANLNGTSGADTITGTSGSDHIRGLTGNDRLKGAGGNDVLFGGFGNDKSGSGADTLRGGDGNDFLDGEDGNDRLHGGDGNDVILAGRGDDVINGGDGMDRVRAAGTLDQYAFSLLAGGVLQMVDEVAGRDGQDTMKSVERIGFNDGYVLRLTGGNNNPYAVADTAATMEDASVLIDVLANDFDPDQTILGKATTLSLVSVGATAEGGTATISAGKVRYDPGDAFDFLATGETATDSFDYTISDGKGGTWTTSVTVTITGTGGTGPSSIDLSTLDGTTGFRLDGVAILDYSGRSVSSAGDVNGDGFDDVIIGAADANPGGSYSGASYVVFGKAGGFASTLDLSTLNGASGFRLDGAGNADHSGYSVSSAGDVNGDGFDDLIVGASDASPGGTLSGASHVVFGKAGGWASTLDLSTLDGATGFRLDGAESFDRTGSSVDAAGDVNGDGLADLIVGAPYASLRSGTSYVVFGKAAGWASTLDLSTLDGTVGFRLDGPAGGDRSGRSVASGGDVNGDGFDDVIIGAPGADPAGAYSGASYVLFGKAGGFPSSLDLSTLDGATGFRLDGVDGFDQSGISVASAGDVNGDGFDDLIVGAYLADSVGNASGASHVVFGKAGGFASTLDLSTLNGTSGFRLDGEASLDRSGRSVASAGDVNGDGFDDLIVGSPYASPDGSPSGASYVVFGKAAGFAATLDLSTLDGTNGFRLDGVASGDFSGRSVASAGDVNGDGFDDLIIGALGADPSGSASGASYVVFGGNFTGAVTHLGTAASETLTGTAAAETFVGGRGNDILVGGGGNDAFHGGEGNDTIVLAESSFRGIDGGRDVDTIRLAGSGLTLDLTTTLPDKIESIERIDITGSGNNSLKLSVLDVLDLSDESNSLRVDGNAGDAVIRGNGWTQAVTGGTNGNGTSTIDGQTYQHYASGQAVLLVDTDITAQVA